MMSAIYVYVKNASLVVNAMLNLENKELKLKQQIHQFISVTKVYVISVVQNAVNLKAYVYMHVQKY